MNRKLLGLMAIATTVLASAAVISVVSTKAAEPAEPVQVNANDSTQYTLFFDTEGYKNDHRWDCSIEGLTNFYFRYWTGTANGFLQLTRYSNQYWCGKLSTVNMQSGGGFCIRNSSSGSDDTNETAWINWDSWKGQGYNCLQLKGSEEGNRCGVNWLTLSLGEVSGDCSTTYVAPGSLAPSYLTQRIWCRASSDSWYSDGVRTAIRSWTSEATTVYITSSILNSVNGLYYWYADIPLSVQGFQFVRLHKAFDGIYNYSANGSFSIGSPINFISFDSGQGKYVISSVAPISDGQVSANLAAKVLEGYSTCSNNSYNGNTAVSSLSTNWINTSKMNTSEWSTFQTTQISDYSYDAYHANSDLYSSGQSKSATTTCGDKWARMQAEAEKPTSLNLHGEESGTFSESISALGAFALLVSLGFGGFILFRKRKSVN